MHLITHRRNEELEDGLARRRRAGSGQLDKYAAFAHGAVAFAIQPRVDASRMILQGSTTVNRTAQTSTDNHIHDACTAGSAIRHRPGICLSTQCTWTDGPTTTCLRQNRNYRPRQRTNKSSSQTHMLANDQYQTASPLEPRHTFHSPSYCLSLCFMRSCKSNWSYHFHLQED